MNDLKPIPRPELVQKLPKFDLDPYSVLMNDLKPIPRPELVQKLPKFDLDPYSMPMNDLKPIPRPELVQKLPDSFMNSIVGLNIGYYIILKLICIMRYILQIYSMIKGKILCFKLSMSYQPLTGSNIPAIGLVLEASLNNTCTILVKNKL